MIREKIKLWLKDDGTDGCDERTRLRYGTLSSVIGILANLLLFGVKLTVGLLLNAVSIVSDAMNNLTDCFSCIMSFLGYRLAVKPADEHHPFGHGRMEYLASLAVSVLIFLVGYELAQNSIERIIRPQPVLFSAGLMGILVITVVVKLWLASFNRRIGRKIDNIAMIAMADDARNDALVTSVTIFAMIMAHITPDVPWDGFGGLLISGFIFFSGYKALREIVDRLLGRPVRKEVSDKIREIILEHPEIIGVHDLMVHDYGPGRMIGSAHAEVDSRMDFLTAHDIIDQAEKEIGERMNLLMTLHLDPVDLGNVKRNQYEKAVCDILRQMDERLAMHDFRMVTGPTHTNLVFDILVPYRCSLSVDEIRQRIDTELRQIDPALFAAITFDRDYIEDQK